MRQAQAGAMASSLSFAVWRSHGADGLHRFRTGADRQLRTQAEARTGFPVDTVMGRVGVGDAFLPAYRRDPGGSFIETALRLLQRVLMACYVQLDADGSCERFVHKKSIVQTFKEVKRTDKGRSACGQPFFPPVP